MRAGLHRRRDHGGVIFIDLRDREGSCRSCADPDTPETFRMADRAAQRIRAQRDGRGAQASRRHREPQASERREIEVLAHDDRDPQPVAHAAVPARRREPDPRTCGSSTACSTCGASRCRRTCACATASRWRSRTATSTRIGLHRHRDADADALDAGRRARLPRALARACRPVLRAAAVAAAVQAAADGRRASTATTRS